MSLRFYQLLRLPSKKAPRAKVDPTGVSQLCVDSTDCTSEYGVNFLYVTSTHPATPPSAPRPRRPGSLTIEAVLFLVLLALFGAEARGLAHTEVRQAFARGLCVCVLHPFWTDKGVARLAVLIRALLLLSYSLQFLFPCSTTLTEKLRHPPIQEYWTDRKSD